VSGARHSPRRTRLRLAVVGVVLVGALAFLLVEGLGNALDYYDTVPQALAHRTTIGTSQFRLEGVVIRGSVERTTEGATFAVSDSGRMHGKVVEVRNVGTPPSLFEPGIPVIVVGHFAAGDPPGADALFLSNAIMVKHSADYIPATSKSQGAPRCPLKSCAR